MTEVLDQRAGPVALQAVGTGIDVADQVARRRVLDIHVDADFSAREIQHLVKGGDLGSSELRALFDTGIERLDPLEGHLGNLSGSVGAAIDGSVVAQHQLAIGRGPDIDLDEIGRT